MPCYTIKKTTVNVSTMDVATLIDGLTAAGFDTRLDEKTVVFYRDGFYHTYHNGVLTLASRNVEGLTTEVKRAYSAQIVRQSAKQFGWKLNEKTNQQFVAQKRR